MSMVGYPPSMFFEAVAGLACEYKCDEKSLGSLTCTGVSSIYCEAIDAFVGCHQQPDHVGEGVLFLGLKVAVRWVSIWVKRQGQTQVL